MNEWKTSIPGTFIKPEKLFDNLGSFDIKCSNQQKSFQHLAIFNFQSICVQEKTFKDTKTIYWIGRPVAKSVTLSSNFLEEPNFLSNFDSHHHVESYIGCLEVLALQSKIQIKFCLPDIETTKKIKLGSILENPPIVIFEEGKPV